MRRGGQATKTDRDSEIMAGDFSPMYEKTTRKDESEGIRG